MPITTNDAIEKFGTQDLVTGTPGTVADGAFSVAGDVSTWTNDDDAIMATATALFDWDTTAPDVNSSVNLYARLLNVQSTNDQDVPDANFGHTYLGSFPVNDVLTNQYISIEISLPNTKSSQEYEFYIENNTGETIQNTWDLWITPKAIGPHS